MNTFNTLKPLQSPEFRQIMELNRNVEVKELRTKRTFQVGVIFLTCWDSLRPASSISGCACLQNDKWSGGRVSQGGSLTLQLRHYFCPSCVAQHSAGSVPGSAECFD